VTDPAPAPEYHISGQLEVRRRGQIARWRDKANALLATLLLAAQPHRFHDSSSTPLAGSPPVGGRQPPDVRQLVAPASA